MKARIFLRITLLFSITLFSAYSFIKIPVLTQGFAAYYTFSRMLIEGDDLSKAYDFDYFNSKVKQYGFINIADMPNNLPTNSLVISFLAWLEPKTAKIIWGIMSILFLTLSALLLLKLFEINFRDNLWLIFASFFFMFYPVYQCIALGQIYLFLLFLFTASLYFIKQSKEIFAALPVSLAFIFKGYGFLISLWFMVRKNYKSFLAFTIITLSILLVSIPVLGYETWVSFYKVIPSVFLQSPSSSNTAYQTIGGFIKHLFVFDEKWNLYPVTDIPHNFVFIFAAIINLAFVIWILIRTVKAKNNILVLLSYSAVLGVSVITAPMAEEYHYVLFIPLIIGLGKILFGSIKNNGGSLKFYRIFYVISAIVLAIPLNYKLLQDSKLPLIFLAYPKLYAGIILIILFLFFVRRKDIVILLPAEKKP